jgi:putative PIN family toxin of toxin-antitoxin system
VRPLAVFDTNILFSAVGWKGKPFECLELARANTVAGVTCRELLVELADKLERKLLFSPVQVVETVADLMTFLRLVSIPGVLKAVRDDPEDDKVLECAEVAAATHIVTGDRRHLLPIRSHNGIAIVTAADFLELVKKPG